MGGTLLMFTSDEPFLRFPSFRQAPRGKDGRKYADGRETMEKTVMELSVEEEQELLNSPGEAAVMDHVYRALGFLLFCLYPSVSPRFLSFTLLFPLLLTCSTPDLTGAAPPVFVSLLPHLVASPSSSPVLSAPQPEHFTADKKEKRGKMNGWIRNCCLVALNRTTGSHWRRRRSESSTN